MTKAELDTAYNEIIARIREAPDWRRLLRYPWGTRITRDQIVNAATRDGRRFDLEFGSLSDDCRAAWMFVDVPPFSHGYVALYWPGHRLRIRTRHYETLEKRIEGTPEAIVEARLREWL